MHYAVREHALSVCVNEFQVPRASLVLGVGHHADSLCVWIQEWNDYDDTIPRRFLVVKTGRPYSDEAELGMSYVGTVVLDEPYHVFELLG